MEDAAPQFEHFRRLERMYASAPINGYFAPVLRIPEAGVAEVRLTVRPDFHHAARAAHGAVYFKALDDATFFAVSSLVQEVFVLTVSFNLYLTRPIGEGEILAVGRVVTRSRRLYVAEGLITDNRGREIARGSGAFLPSNTALSEEIGYR
jgi:uncharacterized protein (TIGR00369 family)